MALVDETRVEQAPTGCAAPRIKPHSTAEIRAAMRTPKTLWCPGCSNGIITRALIDAILGLELDPEKVVVVSGIGCSGRMTAYLNYSTVHTAHGRALPTATGIRIGDPSLRVIVVMGDGDSRGDRRQPPHPRGAAQHRPDGARPQQQHLRHDRRADEPVHASRRQVDDDAAGQHRTRLRPVPAGERRGSDLRRPRHLLVVPSAGGHHRRRTSSTRASRSSRPWPCALSTTEALNLTRRPGRVPHEAEGTRRSGGQVRAGRAASARAVPGGRASSTSSGPSSSRRTTT